jgi:hypothetical protein
MDLIEFEVKGSISWDQEGRRSIRHEQPFKEVFAVENSPTVETEGVATAARIIKELCVRHADKPNFFLGATVRVVKKILDIQIDATQPVVQ